MHFKGDTFLSIKIDGKEVVRELVEMENKYFKESIASKYKWAMIDPSEAGINQAQDCQEFVQTNIIVIISSGLKDKKTAKIDSINERADVCFLCGI